MSQSPIDDFSERSVTRYRQGWKALNRLLHEDRSFSGHERNCAFLNTGGDVRRQPFADISAASGLDFDDDARAVALADWDFDGDLDIWITNRTAPRIRFLRNNNVSSNHFLAIQLIGNGKTTNRDAVGARVEVVLADDQNAPLLKTMTAGDGFLSQSSRWLHFGLGHAEQISQVVVHWPGGERTEYSGFEIDRRYIIDQASGEIRGWSAPTARKPLVSIPQDPPLPLSVARTVLPARRLLPNLQVTESESPLNAEISKPTVITLWSATCRSCVQELEEFSRQEALLRKAGLDVIAINLDNLNEAGAEADNVLAQIGFPFTTRSGTVELVRSLDVLKRAIFDRWQPLTVPVSFLVDDQGFVGVIYQGPVPIRQLVSDVKLLRIPSDQLRDFCSPFSGRWVTPPPSADPLQVTSRFIDEALVTQGIEYLERHAQLAEQSPSSSLLQAPGDLYYVLAVLLRDQEQNDASLNAFAKAIQHQPDDFRYRNDFASLLAATGQLNQAAEQLLQSLRIKPQDIFVQRKLGFLRMAEGNPAAAIPRFRAVVDSTPQDIACWYNLANAYRRNEQLNEAMETYRHTLKLEPRMTLAANNLAWVLVTHPDDNVRNGPEAVKWAKQACEQTNYRQPTFLDTLACAHAEAGNFDKAIAIAGEATQLYTQLNQSEKARTSEDRIRLFREKRTLFNQLTQ